jgi:hypothetical protein
MSELEMFQIIPKRLCRIILVHGTWPAGILRRVPRPQVYTPEEIGTKRAWFENISSFRIRLSVKLTMSHVAFVFYPFVWTGQNFWRNKL